MDAVKFLKEKNRMCDSIKVCRECQLDQINKTNDVDCFDKGFEEEAVAIVEKWSARHPIKTRQSEFLKLFPNALCNDDGVLIPPCDIDTKKYAPGGEFCKSINNNCCKCRKEYWLAPVECLEGMEDENT